MKDGGDGVGRAVEQIMVRDEGGEVPPAPSGPLIHTI